MSNYECNKCGETASSKCAFQRTVFPSDQYATVLGNMIKVEAVRRGAVDERYRREADSDVWLVTYTITSGYIKAQDEDEAVAMADVPGFLTSISKETLKRAFCDHVWTIRAGAKCQFGCCIG